MTATTSAPPGWYADPVERAWLRYWDGWRWTAWVSVGGQVHSAPITAEQAAIAWAERTDQRARWPGWVAAVALVAAVVSAGLASLFVVVGEALGFDGPAAELGFGVIGLHSGLLSTCWGVHRGLGTGKGFLADFGLAYRPGDWWRGLVGSLAARGAAVAMAIITFLWSTDFAGNNVEVYDEIELDLPLLVLFALVAVVMAPFVEELFFRGLLMRALESVVPAWLAVGVQALLFGLAHVTVDLGKGNVTVVAAIGAAGVIFGIVARRYDRLAPAMFSHGFFNVLPIAVIFAYYWA